MLSLALPPLPPLAANRLRTAVQTQHSPVAAAAATAIAVTTLPTPGQFLHELMISEWLPLFYFDVKRLGG
jgi:hypothetical protein